MFPRRRGRSHNGVLMDDSLDGDREQVMAVAAARLTAARALIDEISESFRTSATADDLPPFEPPDPVVPAGDALPSGLGTVLVSSARDFGEQCRALRASKAYGGPGGDEDGEPS
jgi:hypothetical protein